MPALIEALPPALIEDLLGLDLAGRDLSRLGVEVILVHGRDDTVIPYTESQALAAAIGAERTAPYLPDNLRHVDLDPGGLADAVTLWRAAYALLSLRDRLARQR